MSAITSPTEWNGNSTSTNQHPRPGGLSGDTFFDFQPAVVAIRSGGGLFQSKQQTLLYHQKIKPIMKEEIEYDVITQSIEIPEDVIERSRISVAGLELRAYVMSELTRQMTEKLIKSGYITETWIKREGSEECTLTLYVKPLIKKD